MNIRGGDRNPTGAGLRIENLNVVEGSMTVYEKSVKRKVGSKSNNDSETSSQGESTIGLRGTSRAVLCATKFKRVTSKGSLLHTTSC